MPDLPRSALVKVALHFLRGLSAPSLRRENQLPLETGLNFKRHRGVPF